MNNAFSHNNELKPSDLPGILRYVRLFRRQTFFIGIDEALAQNDTWCAYLDTRIEFPDLREHVLAEMQVSS